MANKVRNQLGRKTIAALIEHLESRRTWTQLRHFLFEHGLDERFVGTSKLDALGNVFYPLARLDADQDELHQAREALEEITQGLYETIRAYDEDKSSVSSYEDERARSDYEHFQRALRADGLDLIQGRISPFLSSTVSPPQEQGVLELRLRELGFTTTLGHLSQATDNAARGNWESANSQVGSFLESLCEGIAARISTVPSKPPSRGEARKFLEESGFLDKTEADLLRSFFQLLHSAGGRHAGTSSENDCHRRRLIAIALANYYLERLESLAKK